VTVLLPLLVWVAHILFPSAASSVLLPCWLPQGAPRRLRMHHQPDCSGLMLAHLPCPGPDSSLEFSITGATYDSSSTLSTLSTMVRGSSSSSSSSSSK
jgi:hypothetical protein